jgi:hypothetical protein
VGHDHLCFLGQRRPCQGIRIRARRPSRRRVRNTAPSRIDEQNAHRRFRGLRSGSSPAAPRQREGRLVTSTGRRQGKAHTGNGPVASAAPAHGRPGAGGRGGRPKGPAVRRRTPQPGRPRGNASLTQLHLCAPLLRPCALTFGQGSDCACVSFAPSGRTWPRRSRECGGRRSRRSCGVGEDRRQLTTWRTSFASQPRTTSSGTPARPGQR